MAHVDVITPTVAGRETWLEQAKQSVLRQSYQDVDHLIRLDTDGRGPGFLRNDLVANSRAEWLVFLDDDDLLDPHFVEWMLDAALDQRSDLAYAPCRYPPDSPWRPAITKFDPARLRSSNYIPVTVLIRRDVFNDVGGFPITAPYEDWQLWLRLMDANKSFGYFPHVCWTYRLHAHPWTPLW